MCITNSKSQPHSLRAGSLLLLVQLKRELEFHEQASVEARAVAHMNPTAAFLVDALVNGEVEALDECQQAAVGARRADGDVGGLAALVLACRSAAYQFVQHGAAVAAVDPDGAAPGVAQRVEDVVHEGMERGDGTGGRRVVYAQASCGIRTCEFLDGEVSHRVLMRMWALG